MQIPLFRRSLSLRAPRPALRPSEERSLGASGASRCPERGAEEEEEEEKAEETAGLRDEAPLGRSGGSQRRVLVLILMHIGRSPGLESRTLKDAHVRALLTDCRPAELQ
ncbi:hypothetical protein AOLI_G00279060 [Acnodon oligacanthus]